LKTTDGGNHWQPQTSGSSSWLYSVCFTDAMNGWAIGSNGTILRTLDGGESWVSQHSGSTNYLSSVYFYDTSTGWVVGSEGIILKTVDGGTHWISKVSGTTEWLKSVYSRDEMTGWAVGTNGILIMTTDGGESWSGRRSFTTKTLNTVFFVDDTTGWIAGESGTILKLVMGEQDITPINEEYISSNIPHEFLLYQNYPNPFNPSTTIEFTLPKSEFVKLKVYNILGKEVAIIVSNKLNQGNYNYQFDGSNLASGIYYYQIVTGEYRKVKKMILLR
jgi:photosystem II stability/assembly factor-like uncharacterized protein